jgi:hypothetical protein
VTISQPTFALHKLKFFRSGDLEATGSTPLTQRSDHFRSRFERAILEQLDRCALLARSHTAQFCSSQGHPLGKQATFSPHYLELGISQQGVVPRNGPYPHHAQTRPRSALLGQQEAHVGRAAR